jgi:hypothetical protein
LLSLALPVEPLWGVLRAPAKMLTQYAVKARYPGSWATRTQARSCIMHCKMIRRLVRQSLGLRPT